MDFPFQTPGERQTEKMIKQMNQQKSEIDQLSVRVKTTEERCNQLFDYILSSKVDDFRGVVTELYKFRVVDVYRSFFSREYFMGSVQQALGYWHQAQNMEKDEKGQVSWGFSGNIIINAVGG